MSQVTFSIPDEILLALKVTPEDLAAGIRIAAAVKLLGHLADYGVNTFDLSEAELSHDLKSA